MAITLHGRVLSVCGPACKYAYYSSASLVVSCGLAGLVMVRLLAYFAVTGEVTKHGSR